MTEIGRRTEVSKVRKHVKLIRRDQVLYNKRDLMDDTKITYLSMI